MPTRIVQLFQGNGQGGDATVVLELQRQYLDAGIDVRLYSPASHAKLLAPRAEAFGVSFEGVDSWRDVPDDVLRKADAVHLHTGSEYLNLAHHIRPLAGRVERKRLFGTAHGPQELVYTIRTVRQMAAATLAASRVNRIIVPSEHKVREWRSRMPLVRNVLRVGYPIRSLPLVPRAQAHERLGLSSGDATVAVFVGLFRPEKGAINILEAAEEFRDQNVHFAFAGSGPEEARCRAYAASRNIRASFHGYLTDPGLALSAGDVFLFPSTFESFGISLMQAAMAALPVATSDLPVVGDELQGSDSVSVFRASDSKDLARALRELLARGDLRESAADLAKRLVERYEPAAIAREHLRVFGLS